MAKQSSFMERYEEWKRKQEQQETQQKAQQEEFTYTAPKGGTIADRYEAYKQQRQAYEQKQVMASGSRMANVQLNAFQRIQSKNQQGQAAEARKKAQEAALEEAAAQKKQQDHVDFINLLRQKYMPDATKPPQVELRKYEPVVPQQEPAKPAEQKASDAALAAAEYDRRERDERDRSDREAREALLERLKKEGEGGALPDNAKAWASDAVSDAPAGAAEISAAEQITKWETDLERIRKMRDDELSAYGQTERWQSLSKTIDDVKKAIADKQKEVDSQQEEQIFGKPETAATGRGGELTEGAQAGPGIPMSKSWDRMREMAEGLKQPDAAQAQEPQEAKPELSLEELQANREQILADIARYDAAAKTNKVGMQDVEGQRNKANSAAMKAQAEKALEAIDTEIKDTSLVDKLQKEYDAASDDMKAFILPSLGAAKAQRDFNREWSNREDYENFGVWLGDRLKQGFLGFNRRIYGIADFITNKLGLSELTWSTQNKAELQKVTEAIDRQNKRTGKATSTAGEVVSMLPQFILQVIMNALSAGLSGAAQIAAEMGTAGAGLGANVLQAAKEMASTPAFISTVLEEFGGSYVDAKEAGDSELKAFVKSVWKAVTNGMLEMGGLEDDSLKLLDMARGEGGEEVTQGLAGRALDWAFDANQPDHFNIENIVSINNPDAIINPLVSAKEYAMGFIGGGIMGSAMKGLERIANGPSQQGQEFNYGLALRDIITPQAAQAIQTVASTLPEGSRARQLAEKFDPHKPSGEMFRETLKAVGEENQQVLIDTVAQSVEERLRELGEKGDVSAVAQAVAAVYGGLEITPERRTALTSSQYGIDLLKIMQAKDAAQYRAEMEEAAEREQAALDQANDEAYAAILNEVEGADQIAIEPEQRGGFARAYELLRFGMSAEQAAKQSGLSAELAEQIKGLADQKWAQDLPGLLEKAAGVQAQMPEVGKGKISFDPGVDRDTWTKEQRDQVKAIAPFVQAMGYQVEVYQSVPDADGEFRAENGSYLREDGTYRLDINAGRQTQDVGSVLTALAMGHEVYHHLQNTVPDLARSYSGIVLDYLAEKMDVGAAIEAKMNRARANGRSINLNTAVEEVLADASEMMLNDTQAPRMLAEKNPRLFKRIKEWIANFAKRVREAFAGIEPSQKESKALTEQRNGILKYINDLNERFDSMLVEEATRRTAVQAERKAEAPKAEAPKAKSDKAAKKTAPLAQVTAKAGIVPAPVIQDGVVGSYGVTYTADNEEVGFYYAVVPQASVNASMTAEGVPNERFTGVQPRDTDRLNSKSFIDRVGGHELNYARVSDSAEVNGGAPVVDKDLVVQAGNHRKAAIEKALSKGGKTGSRYTADLKADAANKGIDPSKVVEGMMLVRVQVLGPDLTIKGNDPTTQRYSATELAEVDAQRLTPAMLDLADMMGGDINAKANARFVARFISEVVPKAEQGMMLDKNGRLSTEGERRIRNALFQYVYQDEALTASVAEATDPESRNILTAMTDIAPRMAMLNDDMQRGTLDKLPVSSEFAEAYRTVLRQKQSGRTVDEYLAQVKMQEETPVQRMLLQMMADHKRSAVKMGEALDSVLDELETRADRQQIDMLGEHTAPSVQAVVKAGLERFRGDLAASERFSEREQSTLDRKYLQAVEKGDTRAAQEMVDEAARAAGYDVDNIGKVYHGTAAQFNEFNPSKIADGSGHGRPGVLGQLGFYFTNDAEMASSYAYTPASKDRRVISAYIKTDNPLHISDEGWGSAISQADRRESELRRWASEGQHDSIIVESTDEILVDKDGKEFTDKVIVVFDPEQIKSADPITYDDQGKVIPLSERFNSENADIRFSMRETVEETRDLIAVHNLNEQKLRDVIGLGGFPMPSIAVTKAEMGHNDFGNISVVFRKEAIDPKRHKDNRIYSQDAWTPTFPRVGYKISEAAADALSARLQQLVPGKEAKNDIKYDFYPGSVDDMMSRGGLGQHARDSRYIQAYATEHNIALPDGAENWTNWDAVKWAEGKQIDFNNVASWLDGLMEETVEKKGIWKGADIFTPSGNRRGWSGLYADYTLDNIVKAMKKESETGASAFSDALTAAGDRFSSIKQMKGESSRIQTVENYTELKSTLRDRLYEAAQTIAGKDKSFQRVEGVLNEFKEAAQNRYRTADQVSNFLNRISNQYQLDYNVNPDAVQEFVAVMNEARNLPVQYFEAKPRRAMPLYEVAAMVVPEGTSEDVTRPFTDMGIEVQTYEPGNKADRTEKLNNLEKWKFSERQRDLLSKRDILAGAFDQVAKTETEKQKLNNYKRMVRQLNRLEAEAADLRQQNTAERRKKSGADKALIAERSKQIAEIEERIDSADRRLIRLQNAAPLRNVLKREIAQRVKEAKAEYRGAAAERRAKTADRYDARISELKTKHADYRAHVSDKKLRDGYVGRIEKTAAELNTWLQAPDKKKYVNEGMRKTVSSLLESLDMSSFTKEGEARASKRAKSWQESMSALSAQMNAMDMRFGESEAVMVVDPDLAVDIQNLISENDGEVSYRNLSTEDLEKMESIIRRVKKAVTTVNTMHTMGRNTQVEDVAMGTISYAEGQREKKLRGSVAERLSTMMSLDMSDAFTYFESLGPDAQKVLHSLYNKGFGRLVENTKTAQEFFERLNNKYKGMATWSGKKATVQTFDVEGGKLHLTPGNIMELYLLNQREQARGHIYGKGLRVETEAGRGRKGMYQIDPVTVTTEDVNRILSTLTEDQTRAAKEISDFLNSTMSDWGNEVSMELYGYNKLIEQSYYPIRSDTNATLTKDPDANFSMNALLNLGMMKALNKNANNAIYVGDIFGTIAKHITDMANYNAFAAPLVDAMKWFNFKTPYEVNGRMTTRNVKGSIERLHGTAGKAYFVNLLKAVNGIRTPTVATGFSGLINSLVGKMKVSAVAGNARVIMQQHASYSRASAMMNPLDMAQAYLRSPKRGMEMAQKYSPIAAWKHMGYFDMNIGRQMDALITGKESAFNKVQEAMLKPAGFMDDFTLGVLWNAAEIELGRTYAGDKRSEAFYRKVGERVTEVVDRTQVVDTVFHRSQVMRDKDGLIKITTNFMAEPIKTYNLLMSAIRSKDIKKIARVGTSTLASWIVTAAAAGMIDALRDKDKDKGWAGYWESYLRSTFGLGGDFWESNLWDNANPANMIPFAKDVYGLATGFSPSRPDLQAAQRIVWAGNDWLKLFNGEYKKTPYDLIYSTAAAISTVTGMPINNVMRDTVSTIDTLNPAMVGIAGGPSAKAVYKRYAEAADAGDAEAALDYYNKLLEMGQSEKDIDTGYWNAQEGKKYDEWASSIVSGTDLKKTMQRYLDHGVTAQTLGGQITKMFKPEYVALVKSGKKAEAAKLKGYLLNAYVVIGYKREDKNKDIDAWLKEK